MRLFATANISHTTRLAATKKKLLLRILIGERLVLKFYMKKD
jgi:hypothetical protein